MNKNKKEPTIKYFDLYGLRKEKSKFLETYDIKNTKWQELKIKEPHYFFVPKDFRMEKIYSKFISLTEIFTFYNVGGKPGDDKILVDKEQSLLTGKISGIVETLKIVPEEANTEARKNLLNILKDFRLDKENIIEYNYRPFDIRYTYYDERIYTRPVPKTKGQFDSKNICILTTKILKAEPFAHIFVSTIFPDVIFLSNKTSTNSFVFPLHLYNTSPYIQKDKKTNLSYRNLMIFDKPKEKESNIKTEIIVKLSNQYKKKITPEEIFYYIYGILYSNIYREKYQEFLKIDFPKIPFTNDYKLFQKAAKFGKELIDLHLLKSDKLKKSIAKFPKTGDSRVEKREYNEKEKRIYINGKQYFEGVKSEVWNYHIGGYQVLDKWLKDRTDKILSAEDVNHYLKIISILKYTMDLQKQIDEIYPKVEKNLIEK